MQNIQNEEVFADRIEKLEKQNRYLMAIVSVMLGIFVFTGILEYFPVFNEAQAQDGAPTRRRRRRRAPDDTPGQMGNPGAPNAAGGSNCCPLPPTGKFDVVEAKTIVLRDSNGSIRGMWSADDNATTLAVAYENNLPSVVLTAAANKAGVEMNDRMQNTMSLILAPEGNSIYLADGSKQNSVFLGASNGVSGFNMTGARSAKIVTEAPESTVNIRGGNSLLQMQSSNTSLVSLEGMQSMVVAKSDKAAISMQGKTGNKASFSLEAGKSNINFTDADGRTTFDMDSTDGNTIMTMYSKVHDSTKVITPKAEDVPDADTPAGIGF